MPDIPAFCSDVGCAQKKLVLLGAAAAIFPSRPLLWLVADLSGIGIRQNPAGYTPYSDITLEIPPVELLLEGSASNPWRRCEEEVM